jgi:hypothetical protein
MVLPDVNVVLELKKSENLRFNYAITSEYSDVNDYAQAYVFNNYNLLFRGNRELENALSHSYSLTYFSFNLFNYTNLGGNLSYTRKIDAIKTNSELVGINQVSSPINFDSNFPDETFSAVGRFSKTIKKIQFKLDAAVFLSKTNNTVNNEIRESQSLTQNYNASFQSNFKTFPNFEVGYRFMKNDYNNGGSDQTFFTNRPYANVNLRFLKDFNLFAEWDFYNYTNDEKTVKNNYSFLNANLYYQHGESPWEFSIQATNLLNTSSLNNDSFSEQFNISTTTQYLVMPRIVMFVIKYDL